MGKDYLRLKQRKNYLRGKNKSLHRLAKVKIITGMYLGLEINFFMSFSYIGDKYSGTYEELMKENAEEMVKIFDDYTTIPFKKYFLEAFLKRFVLDEILEK